MAVPQAQNQMYEKPTDFSARCYKLHGGCAGRGTCDLDAPRTEGINKIEPGRLQLIPSDLQDMDIPSLLTVEGQEMIEAYLKADTKLIVFDNISTLFRGGGENDDENWITAQEWQVSLRRRGFTTMLAHHDGKTLLSAWHIQTRRCNELGHPTETSRITWRTKDSVRKSTLRVHFISPQDKGMCRHLDISATAEQRPFSLLAVCGDTNASNLDIFAILPDSGGNKTG